MGGLQRTIFQKIDDLGYHQELIQFLVLVYDMAF